MLLDLFIFFLFLVNGAFAQTITYMWVGPSPLPVRYRQKLRNLTYPYELILDPTCDILIERMEQILGRRFLIKSMKYNRLSDVCRYIYIYFNGGTYSDMDVDLDYDCFLKAISNSSNQWPTQYGQPLDNYFFYERQKLSPNLFWLLKNIDAHSEFQMINAAYINVTGFNQGKTKQCTKHSSDKTFQKMTYPSQTQTQKEKEKAQTINIISKSFGFIQFWQIAIGITQILILFVLIKLVRQKKTKSMQFMERNSLVQVTDTL